MDISRYFKLYLILCAMFCGLQSIAQNAPVKSISLNDSWQFSKNKQGDFVSLNLPHTWNAFDVMDDKPGYYRGAGWYKRKLKLSPQLKDKKLFVSFSGANQETEVYVNGHLAGRHIGGYSKFIIPVSQFLNYKDDEIEVKVDNQFNEDIAPLTADFTFFGGIYRNVNLIVVPAVHFSKNDHGGPGVYLTTPSVSKESATVLVRSLIDNLSSGNKKITVQTVLKDRSGKTLTAIVKVLDLPAGTQQEVTQQLKTIKSPKLWAPADPYLYRVITTILDAKSKEIIEQVSNPLGLRWFKFDAAKGFFLNGEPLKLIGASRHQDYEGLGNAVPDALQVRDVELLKEMGGNFLRVAHYPQDQLILETCDRLGILASVEIPVVNTITESEAFTANCKEMQIEMIRQNFNHPSVVIWAYMNEVLLRPKFSNDKVRQELYYKHIAELAQTLDDLTRKEDASRYTMIANHGAFDLYHRVGLTKIPMIVGWNLYSGWYGGELEDFGKFLDQHHQELPDQPMLVTEYGADADPRIRSSAPVRFDKSQEYALKFNQVYLDEILKRPFVSGAMAWNLADFSSESREETMPHMNNKGLLTLGREPKDSYFLYQAYLLKRPFVKITSRHWKNRSGMADSLPSYRTQPISVATNLASAELFLNGKSLGVKPALSHLCEWQVPFKDGKNQLSVVAGSSRDEMEVDFSTSFSTINVLLGAKRYYTDEKQHQLWVPDRPYQKGLWGFIGGAPFRGTNNRMSYGSDKNIYDTDDDPVFQTQQQGIERYRFDVPDGEYALTLCFAELLGGTAKEILAYNLDNTQVKEKAEQRIFDVSVNGRLFLEKLNLAADYGYTVAVKKKTSITVQDGKGILIEFKAIEGKPVLNAVQLEKIY